jgi:hypothetical protein
VVALAAPTPTTPPTPPTRAPHASTTLPPSASTRCPPGSVLPNSRAPFASTSTHAMPRNPDARLTPEEPMRPQVPPC